jgi:hypothetical protein
MGANSTGRGTSGAPWGRVNAPPFRERRDFPSRSAKGRVLPVVNAAFPLLEHRSPPAVAGGTSIGSRMCSQTPAWNQEQHRKTIRTSHLRNLPNPVVSIVFGCGQAADASNGKERVECKQELPMKKNTVLTAILALLVSSAAAFADPNAYAQFQQQVAAVRASPAYQQATPQQRAAMERQWAARGAAISGASNNAQNNGQRAGSAQ